MFKVKKPQKTIDLDFKNRAELEIYYCGHQDCAPNFYCGPLIRNHYLFHFITKGSGVFEVRGKRFELSKGDGFLIFPEELFKYQANGDTPWSYSWFGFNGREAEKCVKILGLSRHNPIYRTTNKRVVTKTFSKFLKEFKRSPRELRHRALLYDLLDILSIEHCHSDMPPPLKDKKHIVDDAIEIMSKELGSSIAIQEIAKRLGVSRSTLFTVFKEQIGRSPKHHLKLMRLEMSLEYLRNPSYRIAEVANSVGYPDPLFYSREFKNWLGVSPKHFRESRTKTITSTSKHH